ncbi:MAG: acyl-CoA thioester hydrolase/BAAT C-terminal domain-containing protein [Candidatus Bathyarchaeia archaeon]
MSSIQSALKIPVENVEVKGNMFLPQDTKSLVIFAHGSGSSRFSPRNQYVAKEFNKAGMGTLLFDLLTPGEEEEDTLTGQYRFDINLLSKRLVGVTKWLLNDPTTSKLKIGFFGASTGAAAALIASTKLPEEISAVVSRGGRPDLAEPFLSQVRAPTLLLVGGWDEEVISLNEQAQNRMKNENKLVIIQEATHLFEEPGKLEEVAKLATAWFRKYLQ